MDRFKKFIEEEYYRIDHGQAPKTFSGSQSHGYDDDGNHIKGVYATHKDHHMGHAYATPRHIPWVYHQHKNGQKNLYINKTHKNTVEKHTATISKFKKDSGFKGIDGGTEENVSTKDQTPHTQSKINSANHIRKQGIKINYVHHDALKQKSKDTNRDKTLAVAGNENM